MGSAAAELWKMTYLYVLINEPEVTKAEAIAEYERHGLTAADLEIDLGDCETYSARDVVEALGY